RSDCASVSEVADLRLPHPEQELLKAATHAANLPPHQTARNHANRSRKVLGIKQPHVSALIRNRAGSFSVERLLDFLTALGQDVEITVRPTRKPHGAVSVVA